VILVLAYTPALIDAVSNPGKGAPRFAPDNPTPIETKATGKVVTDNVSTIVKK
jgi:hypothetical protein